MKKLFKKKCSHVFITVEKSNAIQFDSMGYPLRLFICKCKKCGLSDQIWIDVPRIEAKEVDSGESFELKWIPLNEENQRNVCVFELKDLI